MRSAHPQFKEHRAHPAHTRDHSGNFLPRAFIMPEGEGAADFEDEAVDEKKEGEEREIQKFGDIASRLR